jgi:hypothetical protein
MRLAAALVDGSALLAHVEPGLRAVRRQDLVLIAARERPKVGDSLDLDEATRAELPEAHRWDYLLSVPAAAAIIGLEFHTAGDKEIRVVIAKKANALVQLRAHFRPRCGVSRWYWVTRGAVGFSRMEKARRLLDQSGIEFVGRQLRHLP